MTIAQTPAKPKVPDATAQVRRAKGIYVWLWLSPVLTLVTLAFLASVGYGFAQILFPTDYLDPSSYQASALLTGIVAVLGSGLWHLVLLYWALDRQSEFVRWHGRQALLLAGLRTALALFIAALFAFNSGGSATYLAVLFLLALWLAGNLWGRGEAATGECSLMRWAGHGAALPLRVTPAMHAAHDALAWGDTLAHQGHSAEAALAFRKILVSQAAPATKALAADRLPMPGDQGSSETADILVAMLRFSQDPARRQAALTALDRAGLVEAL